MKARIYLVLILFLICSAATAVPSDDLPAPLTLPRSQRPAWVREQGIVMAGDWEPLIYRVRRDNQDNKDYTITPEQRRLYETEHTPEMLTALKKLGVNFIMEHCYKAFGMEAEKESMQDAKRFAALCHQNGFRVGVYAFSGTIGWDLFRKELPESKDWELLDPDGNPYPYGPLTYRHTQNRNHKGAQAYHKRILEYAIREIQADLIHLDNYVYGPGYDRVSVERFRDYLNRYMKPAEIGVNDFTAIEPPRDPSPKTAIGRAWLDYSCQSLTESFYDMSSYARSLRPDILMECNTNSFCGHISLPTDAGRIHRYGEAFWDEGVEPSYQDGRITTRQIIYKHAQTLDNMVFLYIRNPLQAAESLAYNTDCLGCICQFEYGKITVPSGNPLPNPVSPDIAPYVQFFHKQRPYYRDADRVWDVGVLRSFASQTFAPESSWQATHRFELACIEGRVPWTLVFDQDLANLNRFRALCLVGADALSDKQIALIQKYASKGGGLVFTDETGTYDDRMRRRPANPFADLIGSRFVKVKPDAARDEALAAMRIASGGSLSIDVDAPPYVLTEVTEQKSLRRRLVHLVNYSPGSPAENVKVSVMVPAGYRTKRVVVVRPESSEKEEIEFRREQGRVVFTIPHLDVYALISIES
ncbi:MAG: hypothetical protein M1133_00675 [Armatimonadetes bacterium]|nr:hypothetical protein [Armatimonadota bacterium]